MPPRLLCYYVDTPRGRQGHTVLLFGQKGDWPRWTPSSPIARSLSPQAWEATPGGLSAYLRGGPVAAARTLPIECAPKSPPSGPMGLDAPGPGPPAG